MRCSSRAGPWGHGADLFDLKVPGHIYTRIMNPAQHVVEQHIAFEVAMELPYLPASVRLFEPYLVDENQPLTG